MVDPTIIGGAALVAAALGYFQAGTFLLCVLACVVVHDPLSFLSIFFFLFFLMS